MLMFVALSLEGNPLCDFRRFFICYCGAAGAFADLDGGRRNLVLRIYGIGSDRKYGYSGCCYLRVVSIGD